MRTIIKDVLFADKPVFGDRGMEIYTLFFFSNVARGDQMDISRIAIHWIAAYKTVGYCKPYL